MRKITTFLFLFLGSIPFLHADIKLSALTQETTAQGTDLIVKVDNPGGSPQDRLISITNLFGQVAVSSLNTVATPGTYGSATVSPTITIGADGRVISLSSNTISGGGGVSVYPATSTIISTAGGISASTGTFSSSVTISGPLTVNDGTTQASTITNGLVVNGTFTVVNNAIIPVQVNAISSDTIANVAGSSATFNLATTDWHYLQLSTNTPNGLLISNPTVGQQFTVILQQPSTSTLVNWFSGILWPSGSVPTLSTGGGKRDVFSFKTLSSGVYLGFIVAQNQ